MAEYCPYCGQWIGHCGDSCEFYQRNERMFKSEENNMATPVNQVAKAFKAADEKVRKEIMDVAVAEITNLKRLLIKSRKVTKNIEREIKELEIKIAQDLEDV